jgi:hypothetical protein
MHPQGINILALHQFLDASRAYFSLFGKARKPSAQATSMERRSHVRLVAASVNALREFQKTGYQENAPA